MSELDIDLFETISQFYRNGCAPSLFNWENRKAVIAYLLSLKGKILYNIRINKSVNMPADILDGAFNAAKNAIELYAFAKTDIHDARLIQFDDVKTKCTGFEDALCTYTNECLAILLTQRPTDEQALAQDIATSLLSLYKVYSFIVLEHYNIDFYSAMKQELKSTYSS